ncbi:MAG: TetR/AcrR family transcriptional regulator [Pseudoxanthomonas sp.]
MAVLTPWRRTGILGTMSHIPDSRSGDFPASPAPAPSSSGRVRRRQEDRSREMRQRLMDATLRCLAEVGYVGLSISQVAQAAQVSRGAILHHYSTKTELAAAAMLHFFETRYDRLHELLAGHAAPELSLDDRLDVFRREISALFPLNLEIINALRTDNDLRRTVLSPHTPHHAERLAGYKAMFPRLSSERDQETFIAVLVAFLRGLCIESMMRDGQSPDFSDRMFEMFRAMVHLYFAHPQATNGGDAIPASHA